MAESVVSFLLQHLSELLAREAKLLCGLEDRVRSLHDELQIINAYLTTTNAEKSKKRSETEQRVVSQIRDVAHVAEDVIDTFVANVAVHNRRTKLGRLLHGVDHAKSLHDVAEKIDKIKTRISEIHDNRVKYNDLGESGSGDRREEEQEEERARSLHRLRRNVEEEDVAGFVQESKVVIDRLVEGGSGSGLRRGVVSIIGMGGLGKTTLARKVYNTNEVKKHFNCRAWVYVSNECRARELLLGLVKHLMPNLEYECRSSSSNKKGKKADKPRDFSSLNEDELKKRVRECLVRKRFLVVLDDLWRKQDWDEVQDAFPDNNKGGRILITSRIKEVASHISRDPPYCLQFLTEEHSWELFSRKVFRGEEYPCDLDPLGRQMVKSCGGLPLSIVVLAGLLANKEKTHREWSKVVGHVNWYLTRDETQVKDIVLKLSYDNLPTRLKPCFLYLGIFPEDYEIHARQLLEQWVAEGFIQEMGTRDPDDVAEDYLYELIDRSLVQVARVKDSGGIKTCRIHDLLRDLCISESKENKVFQVCTDHSILIPIKPRRLTIHCNMSHYVSSSTNDHSCVRSLFSFDPSYDVARGEWKWLSKGFKLVRVLGLESNYFVKTPSKLGNFIHLRYLRIGSQFVRSIPASICNLQNLQTLDLGPSGMIIPISFPYGILKLRHLRHVYTYGPIVVRGRRSKLDGEVMWNLQTISSIVLTKEVASLIEKGKFPKLRKLGLQISSNFKGELSKLLLSLQQLRHLNKLKIYFKKEDWPSLIGCKPQEVIQSLKHLSHLSVLHIGNARDLAMCAALFPPNITKLTLTGITYLNDDWMNALGNLTKLRILSLCGDRFGSSDSFHLNCAAGRFPQLQVFRMSDMKVQSWKLANGAMPHLQSLVVISCFKSDSLPSELWSLNFLTKVHVKERFINAIMPRNLKMKNGCELIVE